MYRLLISAAHTLMQPGEIFQDLREADLTRKMLQKAIPHLEKSGITFQAVPLDLPLLQRIEWINATGYSEDKGDIFVELHVNDGGKRGIENWFCGAAGAENNSQKLADFLITDMCKTLNFQNQGAKSEFDHDLGSLLILNQTNTISIATEILYIDNAEDIAILKDEAKLDNIAKTLVDSIKKYFEDAKKRPLPKPRAKAAEPALNLGGPLSAAPGLGGDMNFGPRPGGMGLGGGLPPMPGMGGAPKNNNLLMDREQRKEMIINTYKRLLGVEPKQNDLNFYLNAATNEDDIVKKITASKDHETLVKDAIDAKQLRDKAQTMEAEVIKLKSQVNDLKMMHDNLNKLIAYKNHAIMQMQNELVNRNVIKKGEYYDPTRPPAQ